ncbi:MAG: metallophosphoesterase [Candidatus Thermoplasmatota archaeon]
MNESSIKPIFNEPSLIVNKKTLVVADLHIGIEKELKENGVNTSFDFKKIIDKLKILCEKHDPKEIILLGDVKHNIPFSTFKERNHLKNLFSILKKNVKKIHIVPGNHDGNIRKLIPDTDNVISIHSNRGFIDADIGFTHGHSWPSKEVMGCKNVIMAHTHPTIKLSDRLGYKSYESCWVRGKLKKNLILNEKYPEHNDPSIFIIPAFNVLCGGIAINEEGIVGPMGKIFDVKNACIYLLDGSYLGKTGQIR